MSREQDSLTAFKNGQPLKTVPLGAELTIGRHQTATVQLEDPLMSRVHLRIVRKTDGGGDRYYVEDRSTNGTFHNGRKMVRETPEQLTSSSVVRCACFDVHFKITEDMASTMQLRDDTREPPPPAALPEPVPAEAPPPTSPLLQHLVDARSRIPIWTSGEATLSVVNIIEETHDAKTFRLAGSDPTQPLLFSFKPGQFLTLSVPIEGKVENRSYSISSSPSRPHVIEITVKRVPGGKISNYLNDNLKLGDKLKVRGPAGKFSCFNYPSRKILGIAGGSGVTPIMSMARWIVDTAADVDFTFLYSARSPRDIIFRRELEYLATRHPNFRLQVTVSGGGGGLEPWLALTGRIDEQILKLAAPDLLERHVFICGPAPFMDAVKDSLRNLGFPLENLHSESFGAGRVATGTPVAPKPAAPVAQPHERPVVSAPSVPGGRQPAAAVAAPRVKEAVAAPSGFQIVFAKSGKTVSADGNVSLLDLAEQNGIDINYGCRAGSCGACRTKCKPGGIVDMGSDYNLDPDEQKEGYVLACCAKPKSNLLVEA
ncbi:MAG TPA: FAD-binding oxidoreductase [Planctomycetota bacterium]|nr:FAD-binding oxidoreductase [Planctomycetota bacterium]